LPAKYAKEREKKTKDNWPANYANLANEILIRVDQRHLRAKIFSFLSRPFAYFAG